MSQTLRIVIAGPYPREEGVRVGGVQVYSDYLSSGLAARGDTDVHVLTFVRGLDRLQERRTSTGVTVHEVPLVHRYQFATDTVLNVPRMHRVLRDLGPDIVHVQTQTLYPPATLERGYPSVITIHGMGFLEARLAQNSRQRFRGLYATMVERNTLRRAKHVICLNNYAFETMRDYIRTTDVRIIDNSVDDSFFDLPDTAESGRVLFAGLLTDRKNVMGLLEAARIIISTFPGLKLRIAGQAAHPQYYQQCLAYADGAGLGDNVEFLGNVSADGVASELSMANMLVLPARQETSPMIISEAMAAGKPVIATPVGGIPEVVKDGETGFLVPVGDAAKLAERIVQVLTNTDLRLRLGAAARDTASRRFRRSANLDKIVEFYNDVLREERKAG